MAIQGAGLQSIYQRLNSTAAYHPLEADTFADWSMEAGDIVTVSRDNVDYESPVHSATHVWKGVQTVRISSGGDEKRESVARMSRKKYNTGGSGVRSGKALGNRITMVYNGLSAEIVQTESVMSTRMMDMYNGLESYVEQTASHWASALVDTYNGLSSLVIQTASVWSSQLNDAYNGLSSKVEQTASHWSSELDDAYNGLNSKVEQTASHWSSELDDAYNGLNSKVDQTASHWSSELSDAYNGLNSKVEQTASSWSSQLSNAYQGLNSKVEQTASNWSSQLSNAYQGLNSKVEQTASHWSASIEGVVGPDGKVTAASIAVAINDAGESTAHISADKVYIGSSKSSTVISGKLDAADVTADWLAAKFANTSVLSTNYMYTKSFEIGTGGFVMNDYSCNVPDAIWALDLTREGNTYTLKKKHFYSLDWATVGTFSRAIDSSSWAWANGRPTVTLSPQDQSFSGQQITHATPAYDSTTNKWMMEIQAMGSGTPPTYTNIGHSVNLNNYLQDKTGTNKITQNGTYTPSTSGSIIGYSSVEVEVQTGASLAGTWNSGILTVTASPQQETYTAQLSAAATTWDGNTGSRVIWDGTAPDAQHGRLTGYTVSVDATVRYNAGVTDGKNAVTINKGSWSSGQISFTKSEGTASTKTVQLTAAATTWSGNTGSRVIWDGTAADAQHGVSTGYTVTVDASGRYNAGVTAGKNAVTISKGSWSGGQVTFSKSEGTASNSGVKVSLGGSWSGNSYNYTIYDSWSGSAASTGYTGSIDATARYNAGYSAGESAGYSSGYSSGRSDGWIEYYNKWRYPTANASSDSLTVNWPSSTYDSAYNSGPSRTYTLTLDTSNKRVDLKYDGVTFARKSVSDVYNAGQNDVTVVKGSWSGGQISFSKSAGTASNSGVQLGLSGSWAQDGNVCKYNYTINDSWSGSAQSTGKTGSITANPWINPADHEVNHQGNLAYDTLYGITLAGYTLATWRTQAKGGGGGGSHSVSLSVDIGYTGSVSGYSYVGAKTASSLARTYIRVSASCGTSSVKRYWTIN